ncbi:prolyl oligopeptidase family serine peptidase [Ectothiorhodospira shaposhnikovii]|uniref:prolyl oligopeptidase family serine peptidase n=1 Tax=Ectothiorhodospira shaposhnikovii TaxID=1054 RepID=UPI0039A08A67
MDRQPPSPAAVKIVSAARVIMLVLLCLTPFPLLSGTEAKQPLTPDDYHLWHTIANAGLSADGLWFFHNQVGMVRGESLTQVSSTVDPDRQFRFEHAFGHGFSPDGQWFFFRAQTVAGKSIQDTPPHETRLGALRLDTGAVTFFSGVISHEISPDGRFLAVRRTMPENETAHDGELLLHDLSRSQSIHIPGVQEHRFSTGSDHLAMTIRTPDSHEVVILNPATGNRRTLDQHPGGHFHLSWSPDGQRLSVFRAADGKPREPLAALVFEQLDSRPVRHVLTPPRGEKDTATLAFAQGRWPRWSDDGLRLFFPMTPLQSADGTDSEAETALPPSTVRIWHWRDDPIQPYRQKKGDDRAIPHLWAVWHLRDGRFFALADEPGLSLELVRGQHHAVLHDPRPYQPQLRDQWNDIHLVDVHGGERTLVLERYESVSSSPQGRYLLYFSGEDWWTYDIHTGRYANLTATVESRFNDFTQVNGRTIDRPFGHGQWADGDAWVLLYDLHDVYLAQPDGEHIQRLTQGAEHGIRYRQAILDRLRPSLDPEGPVHLEMFGLRTKDTGYARWHRGTLDTLIHGPMQVDQLQYAAATDQYVYRLQTAVDSPDYFLTDSDFVRHHRLTRTNPQQARFHWAGDELVRFRTEKGEPLEARLLYPADYEPGRQYPMIVHIYEQRSDTLHEYTLPRHNHAFNARRLSSEGYFVLEPDIHYELGQPGESALESVVPAVKAVLESGRVDPARIGLVGHSWGGYQVSYIITQTDLFAAAVAGAPITNLISKYNSIYWRTGIPEHLIFETGQARLPRPFWEDLGSYVANSPVFNAQGIDTPLLVMFGTEDESVAFNQGVEIYNTLRRMGKPIVMLAYEGEGHNLRRRENQLDYSSRVSQWHEHWLKGEEPGSWIIQGLPLVQYSAIGGIAGRAFREDINDNH